jgi:hypothetical protein
MRGLYIRDVRHNPLRLPPALRGYRHYAAAYRECLAGYGVDSRGLLVQAVQGSHPDGTASNKLV